MRFSPPWPCREPSSRDFTLVYVDNNDSTFTPLIYRITAMWSDLAGSILLWALVLSGYLTAMWIRFRKRAYDPVVVWAKVTGYTIAAFFFGLMLTLSDPFDRVHGAVPSQRAQPLVAGQGPCGISPAAFVPRARRLHGAFLLRSCQPRHGTSWAGLALRIRRWSIFAWTCLTAGVVLGAWWSYQVLGWSGYWAWDPVENSALLPWLTATAFLHSAMVQQRRAMLRVWNIAGPVHFQPDHPRDVLHAASVCSIRCTPLPMTAA